MVYSPSGIREDDLVDIGFLIRVKPVFVHAKKSEYAGSALTSRMKYQGTTAFIDDLKENVIEAIEAVKKKEPINFYERAVSKMATELLRTIRKDLNPDKFEQLVKWYLWKIGANQVSILSRNDPSKKDYADADVVGVFEKLKHIVYIQAKHHVDETGYWAVEQIRRYAEQKSEDDDYTYGYWVISASDIFSEDAKTLANKNGIRLIDGMGFARMLIDEGMADINEAFK